LRGSTPALSATSTTESAALVVARAQRRAHVRERRCLERELPGLARFDGSVPVSERTDLDRVARARPEAVARHEDERIGGVDAELTRHGRVDAHLGVHGRRFTARALREDGLRGDERDLRRYDAVPAVGANLEPERRDGIERRSRRDDGPLDRRRHGGRLCLIAVTSECDEQKERRHETSERIE
jgi:hypothetical protein